MASAPPQTTLACASLSLKLRDLAASMFPEVGRFGYAQRVLKGRTCVRALGNAGRVGRPVHDQREQANASEH